MPAASSSCALGVELPRRCPDAASGLAPFLGVVVPLAAADAGTGGQVRFAAVDASVDAFLDSSSVKDLEMDRPTAPPRALQG